MEFIEEKCDPEEDLEVVREIFGDDWLGKPGFKTSSSESEDEDFISPIKNIEKNRLTEFPQHITVLEGESKKFCCTICKCKFRLKKQVLYHKYCPTGQKPLKCKLCSKSFVKKSHFEYHIRSHTGEKPFKCSFCGKDFMQKDKVKRHEKTHSEDKGRAKVYEDAVEGETVPESLTRDRVKRFSCDKCDKTYGDKSSLSRHIDTHSGIKNFICEHCGKSFVRKHSLVVHRKIHFGLRQYSCKKCPKAFKNKKELTRHSHTHNDSLNYSCLYCKGKFRRKDNLRRHVKQTHPEMLKKKIKRVKKVDDADKTNNKLSVIVNAVRDQGSPVGPLQSSVITHTRFHQTKDPRQSVIHFLN